MKKRMEYKIISGRTVEIRRVWMPVRDKSQGQEHRGLRKAGNTSLRKITANRIASERKLAQRINCNMGRGDGWMTLKYDGEHLPESYELAYADMERFLRILRREYRKETGRTLLMFWVTANWSPRRKAPARLHQHMVVPADAIELVRRLWQGGSVIAVEMDNRGDHSDLASYMVQNVHGRPGKQHWHCSRGMKMPIVTEPVEVEEIEDLKPEKGSVIRAHDSIEDEDGQVVSSYLRCVLPAAPEIRHGRIVMRPGSGRRRTGP